MWPYFHFTGFEVAEATLNYCLPHRAEVIAQGQISNSTTAVIRWDNDLAETHAVGLQYLLVLKVRLEIDLWYEDPYNRCVTGTAADQNGPLRCAADRRIANLQGLCKQLVGYRRLLFVSRAQRREFAPQRQPLCAMVRETLREPVEKLTQTIHVLKSRILLLMKADGRLRNLRANALGTRYGGGDGGGGHFGYGLYAQDAYGAPGGLVC